MSYVKITGGGATILVPERFEPKGGFNAAFVDRLHRAGYGHAVQREIFKCATSEP